MQKLRIGLVSAVTLCLLAPVVAQQIEVPDQQNRLEREMGLIHDVKGEHEATGGVGSKWIGVLCGEIDPAVRMHISIADGTGLMVNQVVDGSPASAAGLQQFDILVSVDDQPLKSTQDLVDRVNAAGEEGLQIVWLRKGAQGQSMIVPAERPEDQLLNDRFKFRSAENELNRLREWLEKAQEGQDDQPFAFRMLGPATPMQGRFQMQQFGLNQNMPSNLSVQITRNGNKPASITIQREDEKWVLDEGDLDQLPDDVRPFVENMLNGNRIRRMPRLNSVPEHLEELMEEMPWPRMNQEFERIHEQMDRMFDEIHELRESQPMQKIEDDTIDA